MSRTSPRFAYPATSEGVKNTWSIAYTPGVGVGAQYTSVVNSVLNLPSNSAPSFPSSVSVHGPSASKSPFASTSNPLQLPCSHAGQPDEVIGLSGQRLSAHSPSMQFVEVAMAE